VTASLNKTSRFFSTKNTWCYKPVSKFKISETDNDVYSLVFACVWIYSEGTRVYYLLTSTKFLNWLTAQSPLYRDPEHDSFIT